jgi:hypothetical protein
MSTFDVRTDSSNPITEIVFAETHHSAGSLQAYKLEPRTSGDIRIYDGDDYVYVNSAEHARDLIKALEKAIEFGWVK